MESFCTAAAAVRRLTEKPFTSTRDAHVIRFPTSPPAFTHCIALQDGNEALAFLLNGKAPRDAVIVFDRDLAGIDTRDAVRRLASAEGQKPLSFPLFAARVERLLTVP